jgi:uncharacterized damage-inducible protein DinB
MPGVNEPLANVLRYNAWATGALVDGCRALSDAQLDAAPVPGSSGTIREMLLHVVISQEVQALRTTGVMRPSLSWKWEGWDALTQRARDSSQRLIDIAAATNEERHVAFEEGGKRYAFPLSFFLAHAVAHGDQHRSEIKMAMAVLGVASPDLDGWNWARDSGIGGEA